MPNFNKIITFKNIGLILCNFIFIWLLFIIIDFYIYKSDRINIELESRSKLETLIDITKYDFSEAIVSVNPQMIYDDKMQVLSGISNKYTLFCNENGYFAKYFSDRFGFNNLDEEWDKEIDFILLGDSFVHGSCVNPSKNFIGNLKKLSSKNILNLGMGANGPLMNYATLKEYFHEATPKNVIWFYEERSDIDDLRLELNKKILINYFKETSYKQNLSKRVSETDAFIYNKLNKELEMYDKNSLGTFSLIGNVYKDNQIEKIIPKILTLKNLRNYFRKKKSNKIYVNNEQREKNLTIMLDIIKRAKNFTYMNNASFYFVYLPDPNRFSYNKYDNTEYFQIKDFLKKNEINLIDLMDDYNNLKDPKKVLPFGMPWHFSEFGYYFFSKKIFEKIMILNK